MASSSGNVISPESGEKSAQIKQCLQAKTILIKQNVAGFWFERTFFLLEEALLWTGILDRSDSLKDNPLKDGFVSYKQAAFHFTRH